GFAISPKGPQDLRAEPWRRSAGRLEWPVTRLVVFVAMPRRLGGSRSMGAWGVGGFANDTAGDWSWEFANADLDAGLKLIKDALNFQLSDLIVHEEAAETVSVASGGDGRSDKRPPDGL